MFTQKALADFGQGVAAQQWQSSFKQRERSTKSTGTSPKGKV
ncbi:hypothetical protein GARC_1227 [Paraglaciecola arctica BSs20135]|uniref:Uncharacterized protein n=1 Tax=Paraglaciecola arctica BSs20135 TaxID=493475 RepID=K6YJ58_9ALTE|nr:hypothetical protein GARC_1227 [Paraglaciecola arctica BSs20135]